MLPVTTRVGSLAPWRDPFWGTDPFDMTPDLHRLSNFLAELPFAGAGWSDDLWSGRPGMDVLADVTESEDGYELTLEVPGLRREDLDVTVDDGVLTVRGRHATSSARNGRDYIIRERRVGAFERRFVIPETVDKDGIEVRHEHGVLTIDLPKRRDSWRRRLKISVPNVLKRLTGGEDAGESAATKAAGPRKRSKKKEVVIR